MTNYQRAIHLGHKPEIAKKFSDFQNSLIMYDSDNIAELCAVFFGYDIMWSIEALKELAHQTKEHQLEFRVEQLTNIIKQ